MQKIEIIKQNFYISSENVPYVLKDLKELYPQVTGLDYEADTSNLQYLLWVLGLHVRIQVDGSIFTISRIPHDTGKIDNIDYNKVFDCLSTRMSNDSLIVVKIDDNEITYTSYAAQMVKIIDGMLDEMDKKYIEENKLSPDVQAIIDEDTKRILALSDEDRLRLQDEHGCINALDLDKINDRANTILSQLDESEKEGELIEEEEGSILIEDVVKLEEKEELKPTTTLNQKKKGRPKKVQ